MLAMRRPSASLRAGGNGASLAHGAGIFAPGVKEAVLF